MDILKSFCLRILPSVQVLFMGIWICNLSYTDAYFSVYVLLAFISFYLVVSEKVIPEARFKIGRWFLSAFLSAAVLLANYSLFTTLGDPALIGRSTSILVNIINGVFTLVGGFCVFNSIFSYVFRTFPVSVAKSTSLRKYVPFAVFISIVFFHLIHLFLVEYPGNLTEDSFTQISEIFSGSYSNFNTFWHTMILRTVLSAGYSFFSDVNASVALYSVLQVLLMAGAFTYCLVTMNSLGIPRWILGVSWLVYTLVPYNMALSITVWKDVLFAASTLLVLTSWIRIMKGIGSCQIVNYIIFVLGSLLYFFSRTNGWLIYLVSFLIILIPLRQKKVFLCTMASLAVLGWFLLNPMLSVLNVTDDDPVESLSIPIQQVSRVIADGCALSEDDVQLMSAVVDLDEVPSLYQEWISDPMKVEIRSKNYEYFLEHMPEYRQLWIRLGLEYPWEYVKAWVDQTKGYWNAGYDYFLYAETITDNPYGVEKTGGSNPIASLFRLYFGLSRHVIFFEPLHSIGLHIWIVILCFLLNLIRRKDEWVLSVPLLLLVVGLWFGTPVYSCFRYVYPIFVCFPLIVSTSLYSVKNDI